MVLIRVLGKQRIDLVMDVKFVVDEMSTGKFRVRGSHGIRDFLILLWRCRIF